ncbi:Arogenate dehydratase 5, chloroplastic [Dirofilaria immitis]
MQRISPIFCCTLKLDRLKQSVGNPSIASDKSGYLMISGGIEPPTFRVLDGCDNRYTTRSLWHRQFLLTD